MFSSTYDFLAENNLDNILIKKIIFFNKNLGILKVNLLESRKVSKVCKIVLD